MKKKIFSTMLAIAMLLCAMFTLVGCGDSKSGNKNGIADKLNEIVKSSVDKWQEKGYAHTFTMSDIQSSLNSNGNKYVIIACGNKEFTNAPSDKKFTENVSEYSGTTYSNTRGLESELDVNYCVVFDASAQKYYNMEITYKTTKLNDVDKEYPYFQNAKEIK